MINRRTVMLFSRTSGPRSVGVKGLQHLIRFARHSTPKKLANWLSFKLDRALRRARVSGYPYHYVIDPINVCNLRCPLCPTGRGTLKRPGGRMALADFKRIVVIAPIMVDTGNPEDMEKWLPANGAYSFYDYRTRQDKTLQEVKTCPYLWQTCVISWEGAVSPCCWYDDRANDFGNALAEPIQSIWNNEFYVASSKVFRGEEAGLETVCVRCRGRPHYRY